MKDSQKQVFSYLDCFHVLTHSQNSLSTGEWMKIIYKLLSTELWVFHWKSRSGQGFLSNLQNKVEYFFPLFFFFATKSTEFISHCVNSALFGGVSPYSYIPDVARSNSRKSRLTSIIWGSPLWTHDFSAQRTKTTHSTLMGPEGWK